VTRHALSCTCSPTCKARHARYEKRRHYLAATGRPLLIDSTGSVRRVRALQAAGWTLDQAAAAGDLPVDTLRQLLRNRAPTITRRTADRIATGYQRLLELPDPVGPYANRNRRRAAALGWLPPEAWEDDQLDDPDAQPWRHLYELDEVWLLQLLRGDRDLSEVRDMPRPQRVLVADAWQDCGRSLAELERAGLNPHRDRRLEAASRAA